MGDPEDYSIARGGVWGGEGLGIAAEPRLAGLSYSLLEPFFILESFFRSWAVLGRSWGGLGRSWAVLSRSWAVLGRSWAVLGRSWSGLGTILGRSRSPLGLKNIHFPIVFP